MPPAENPPATEQATICCCIESNRLEAQTLLMLETLRRWGGPLGQSRVVAVVPRRGRKLAAETLKALDSFGVELHDGTSLNRLPWFNWYNKVVAVQLAEKVATTPVVIWMDSDTLIVDPLVDLGLPHGDDFAGRRELFVGAVYDDSHPYIPYWKRACEIVGVKWDDIPWMPADGPDKPQRLLFNAGVYAFRRGKGFSESYTDCTLRMMKSRLAAADGNFFYNEQNAVMLGMMRLGLKHRELPRSENHQIFVGLYDGVGASPSVQDARVIHYSPSLYPEHWPTTMARFERERPALREWLLPRGPLQEMKIPLSPATFAYKVARNLQYRSHASRCIRVG